MSLTLSLDGHAVSPPPGEANVMAWLSTVFPKQEEADRFLQDQLDQLQKK